MPSPLATCVQLAIPTARGGGGAFLSECIFFFERRLWTCFTDELLSVLSRADVLALPLSYPAQQSQGGCLWTCVTDKLFFVLSLSLADVLVLPLCRVLTCLLCP